jgi:hypothetical protein
MGSPAGMGSGDRGAGGAGSGVCAGEEGGGVGMSYHEHVGSLCGLG